MINLLLAGQLSWNIPLSILFLTIAALYIFLIKTKNIHLTRLQYSLFLIGLCLLYLAIGSPLLTISYLSFSLHMIHMSTLFFIIPPLLLLGIPQNLYKQFMYNLIIKKIGTWISPKIALITFSLLFFLYHLPFVLIYLSEHNLIQKGFLTFLFILAFRMWWPIVSPFPLKPFTGKAKKKYMFQSGLFIMPACLLFTVSAFLDGISNPLLTQITTHLCLPPNSEEIQLLPFPFNTNYDQFLAGLFMIGLHKISLSAASRITNREDFSSSYSLRTLSHVSTDFESKIQ